MSPPGTLGCPAIFLCVYVESYRHTHIYIHVGVLADALRTCSIHPPNQSFLACLNVSVIVLAREGDCVTVS